MIADEAASWSEIASDLKQESRQKPGGLRKVTPDELQSVQRRLSPDDDWQDTIDMIVEVARDVCRSNVSSTAQDGQSALLVAGAIALIQFWFPPEGEQRKKNEKYRRRVGEAYNYSAAWVRKGEDQVIVDVAKEIDARLPAPTEQPDEMRKVGERSTTYERRPWSEFERRRRYELLVTLLDSLHAALMMSPTCSGDLNVWKMRSRLSNRMVMIYQPLLLSGAICDLIEDFLWDGLDGHEVPPFLLRAILDSVALDPDPNTVLREAYKRTSKPTVEGLIRLNTPVNRELCIAFRKELMAQAYGPGLVLKYAEAVAECLSDCQPETWQEWEDTRWQHLPHCVIHNAVHSAGVLSRVAWLLDNSALDLHVAKDICEGLPRLRGLYPIPDFSKMVVVRGDQMLD